MKISKKNILSAVCSFLEFAGMVLKGISLTCGYIFFIVCILPLWWMLDILSVITSPVWYSILIWLNNKKASEIINISEEPDRSNAFEEFCSICGLLFQNWCNTVWMKWMWQPVVNRLPMSYRDWFIMNGRVPFEEYPVEVQVTYWNYEHDELVRSQLLTLDEKKGLKQNNVIHRLSEKAIAELWKTDDDMRRLLLKTRCEISEDRLKLLLKEKPEWLKPHLLAHTPNSTVYGRLVEASEENEYALGLVKELVEQAIPKPEVLYKVFAKETVVSKAVAEIINKKADKRAVELNIKSRFTTVAPEQENAHLEKSKKEAGETEVQRWTNFCNVEDEITAEAQNKMTAWQYFIFAETGHHLAIPVLQKALYTFAYKGWVESLMKNEWDNIEHPLILPLIKADNDLYNVYLKLKVEKK